MKIPKRIMIYLESALEALEMIDKGNSKAQIINQLRYARPRLKLAITELKKN